MKKISIIILLSILLMLAACSQESTQLQSPSQSATQMSSELKGVPESVVLRNITYSMNECINHKIIHNVDTEAHTDNVEVTLYFEYPFATKTAYISYLYQYNKSSDLWELLQESEAEVEIMINESAYVNGSPWVGTIEGYLDCSYTISFLEIDTSEMLAKIEYEIYFENDEIPDLIGIDTVDIDPYWHNILIDCSYEHYLGNGYYTTKNESLWFWLDMVTGCQPFR